jgi:hypothetical protein
MGVRIRFLGLALASTTLAAGLTVLWVRLPWVLSAELPPLPPPPAIAAAPGPLPIGPVTFEERVEYAGAYYHVGMGFLLRLADDNIIGVTTAHSLGGRPFAPIRFTLGVEQIVASFAELHAPMGTARTGSDLTVDYVLLKPTAPPDAAYVLEADARGAPQPGERVALYGGAAILDGTVETVDARGAWIRMDGQPQLAGLSGSPVLSRHTGQVVGMVISGSTQPGVFRMGINPIGAILRAAGQ